MSAPLYCCFMVLLGAATTALLIETPYALLGFVHFGAATFTCYLGMTDGLRPYSEDDE